MEVENGDAASSSSRKEIGTKGTRSGGGDLEVAKEREKRSRVSLSLSLF